MDTISGTKKKKKGGKETKAELIQMRIVVSKPGSKKYTHSDYNEILRANGKARNEEEQSRFYDEDTLMMAKKIGETKTKSGKKIRINLDELQHYNRNCGYDMDDDFIDDTEAVDDGNFSSRKGRFYVGKGDVKDMNDLDDDDEESEEEEVIPEKPPKKKKFMQPPPQKKDKEKNGVEKPSRSSSDSDSEAEEQPVRRMAGAPPSKRLLAPPPAKKDPTPPKTMEPAKKKPSPPAVSSSSSQSSDIVCLDDEPPVKKQKLPEKPAPSTSSESNGSNGSSAPPPKGNNKGCAVTLLAKQICKQQEELKKKDTATSSASTDSLMETLKALRVKLAESLVKKGKIYQEKGLKSFDDATLIELFQYVELLKHQKSSENLELSIQHVAQSFGLTGAEVLKRMETSNTTMTDSLEWKLTQADLPFLTDAEINSISAQVKAWRSTKEITNSVLTKWLKEVNQQKMNADQARNKLFELIVGLPNVDKPQEAPVELPKHERSRKARMFLNQWVYLSRKYVTMILPKLKKPIPTDGFAKKQVTAVEFLKDHVKKKREQFEIKKARGDHPEDVQFMFSFNDPVLAAIHTYLEEVCDYSLSVGKLSTIVHSIDSLYKAVEGSIPQHIFYIELCRRLQKLTFLLVEEPIKSRLKAKGESVNRHQVVQNPKYQIKWPNGEEPSLRGLNSELQDFETSVMPPTKHAPPTSATLATPFRQSTTPNTAPKAASTAPSADELKRQQSMNQILQVYLGKYLLGAGNSSSINISDASQCPISDEILLLIVTAVSTVGIGLPDQMAMFKNILCNVGQARMALSVAKQKGRTDLKLTSSDYQKIFEFFSSLDKTAARNKLKTLKIQEENTRKLEEKQKKEKEKLLEKEKKEQEKREEKERKEKEKREEKERKEREMKEMAERKRKEEEDRLIAKARLMQQMEDQRRKKEAEEAVEKELERRAKLEKEEANALQGLEEDLLMDDYDFVTEQQSKVDEERKIREAQRATERENQIKLMRAQQLQRRKEDEVPVTPVTEPEPPRHEELPKEAEFTPPSSSSFDNQRNPPKPSDSSSSSNIDILSAAQEAADLDFPKPPEVQAPRPMSAMEKLASLRGRTMSADMKREREVGSPSQHQQIVVNMQGNGSPYIAPTTPTSQQFFPSSSSQSHQDPMMPSQQQQQNQYQQQPTFNSSPMNNRLQNSSMNHQMGQMNHMGQMNPMQQQQPRMPSTSSSGNMYYPDVELREPNKRSMSMSQPLSHLPQQQPQHQSSPQNVQQQQFPINSYQSPVNNTHQMNNSSLMHTPHSNSSMVSQSPQFSSHPSPMSQQFHTPPSVGMLNHPMVPSPMAATQPLQHFNFPPQQQQQLQQQQQMQRQISQQNMLMQQQQNMQNMQQQQHQMMHHQMNQHNYPPNNF